MAVIVKPQGVAVRPRKACFECSVPDLSGRTFSFVVSLSFGCVQGAAVVRMHMFVLSCLRCSGILERRRHHDAILLSNAFLPSNVNAGIVSARLLMRS